MDWNEIFFGQEPMSFFFEIILRTVIMFTVVVVTLNFTGKRGVRQLSIFEMVMIIALGSAAGDPMFYREVGVLHAITVFLIVLIVYRIIIWLITHFEKVEAILEGKPVYLVKDGRFNVGFSQNKELGADEFFSELRVMHIDHLGQLKCAVLESNGQLSVLFFSDEEVKPGLPIWPELYDKKSRDIKEEGLYACSNCGLTEVIKRNGGYTCTQCGHNEWVPAISCTRIT